MVKPPPAPTTGGGSGTGVVSLAADFIKTHYLEIFLLLVGIYISYQVIMEVSKYILKPAYLISPDRGTRRYIGRVWYSNIVKSEDGKYDEYRAFIKDGIFGPIVPNLFADMSLVKALPNSILLDYKSIVYDHKRRMFVGSLTGAEDMELDGASIERRAKDKLSVTDVLVSMAVKSCPPISQYHLLNSGIPIGDELYHEKLPYKPRERPSLPGDVEGKDHVDEVIDVKEAKESGPRTTRPIKKRRFEVRPRGGADEDWEGDDSGSTIRPISAVRPRKVVKKVVRVPEKPPEPAPTEVVEHMSITSKVKSLLHPDMPLESEKE